MLGIFYRKLRGKYQLSSLLNTDNYFPQNSVKGVAQGRFIGAKNNAYDFWVPVIILMTCLEKHAQALVSQMSKIKNEY